jgi:hypothetical protein
MSPTELKTQPTIHLEGEAGPALSSFTFQMYCGLHFKFRRAHYYLLITVCNER